MIYLDNAATTPLDKRVLEAMTPFLTEKFGNPQSQHAKGREAGNAVQSARDCVAEILGCKSSEVYFVSGGTEAGNTALKGVCSRRKKGRIVLSAMEHPALTESAEDMRAHGFEVTYINPDSRGIVPTQSVFEALKDDAVFCGVMAVNNEVGTIQRVREIGEICRRKGVFYYCDCVQAAGALRLESDFCDALGISAHKFYGPKGIGALYLREGGGADRLISGGGQERSFRGGTLNAAAVVGLATALKIAEEERAENNARISGMRDIFIKRTLSEIEGTRLNGDLDSRVASNANISFEGCDGENILFMLDLKGICVSTGSACSAGAVEPSKTLTAMGFDKARAKSAVRFTFGKYNALAEVDEVISALKFAVNKIRNK